MSHRNRSSNAGIDFDKLPESPLTSRHFHRRMTTPGTTAVVPRAQDRPRISNERSRSENHIRLDLQLDINSDSEETSPIYQPVASTRLPSIVPCGTPSSSSSRNRSTLATTPLSHVNARASCSDHENMFLQKKLTTYKANSQHPQWQKKGKVKTFHKIWCFNDDTILEVTQAIERGVRATSAFKDVDTVILERALKTYFKTLKAKIRGVVNPHEE
ncbi:uncharacterized protein LOC111333774 [Stylophora pistillata]|uniref:uncharacterized protein LOC111333774 n=1 Tax=Stylophora pistillata TaxID=50429 RepID=UPI000C045DC6|nr:uncharacterized protein LOC111333774 [Stylophora pistillata]